MDPRWVSDKLLFIAWRLKMWAILSAGALFLLVIAVDLVDLTSSTSTTLFKWGFGLVLVFAGIGAFIEGYFEKPGNDPNDAA
jgi:hypothetical protein